MSATPRTDAYIGDGNDDDMTEGEIAMCEFARSLETELAAVTKQRDELAAFIESLVDANGPHRDVNGSSVIPAAYAILTILNQ